MRVLSELLPEVVKERAQLWVEMEVVLLRERGELLLLEGVIVGVGELISVTRSRSVVVSKDSSSGGTCSSTGRGASLAGSVGSCVRLLVGRAVAYEQIGLGEETRDELSSGDNIRFAVR